MQKKMLITGGCGFIGSNIVAAALVRGITPIVFDNLSSGYRENLIPGVTFVEGDVRNILHLEKAMSGCEVVCHLAASVGNKRAIEDPVTDSEINIIGTLNVLNSARKLGVNRVVFSSSAGVFGELKTLPIGEDHEQNPDSPYGVSKLAAEKMCLVFNKLYGMRNICLRYFNVYGQNQRYDAYGNVIPIFANHLLRSESLTIHGDGEQTRDFVNVKDVAEINLLAAVSEGIGGVYNIGSGTRLSINLLAQMMQRAADREVKIEYSSSRPGDVRDSIADISAAQKRFGFAPDVDLENGLRQYFKWLASDPLQDMEK